MGHELGPAVLDGGDRRSGQRGRVGVPLIGEPGLYHRVGAIAIGQHVLVRLDARDQPLRLEIGDDLLARGEAVHAAVRLGRVLIQPPALVEDIDDIEVVAAADLEVVEVVRRRDLDRAGAGLGIGVFIGDDRKPAPDQRQHRVLTKHRGIARIVGVDRHRGIAEHRFRTGGGDDYVFVFSIFQRIFNVP